MKGCRCPGWGWEGCGKGQVHHCAAPDAEPALFQEQRGEERCPAAGARLSSWASGSKPFPSIGMPRARMSQPHASYALDLVISGRLMEWLAWRT